MKKVCIFLLLSSNHFFGFAQSGITVQLSSATNRFDDIFFIDELEGWSVGQSKIYHTKNGGTTWTEQLALSGTKYLRSIEFATNKIGFCGSLDSTLYKTTDGGETWIDITSTLPKRPKGICGLNIPDPSTVYGVGKYSGGACLIKSTDGGNTWSYTDMTAYARGLVDVYFFNKTEGFVSGIGNGSDGAVLLYTNDGGITWTYKMRSLAAGEYGWKIQSPDRVHLYVSIEGMPFLSSRYFYSSNQGATWAVLKWKDEYFHTQGIGFINPRTGWIGGDVQTYKTIDGGLSWKLESPGVPYFDRFCRINNKTAFFSGGGIFRYDAGTTGTSGGASVNNIHQLIISPNPTTADIIIEAQFDIPTYAMLNIYSADGKLLSSLLDEYVKDVRTFNYNLSKSPAGTYYVILKTNEGLIYKKAVKQ